MRNSEAHDLITNLAWDADERGCWNWPYAVNKNHQPILSIEGNGVLAHRVAYRMWRQAGHRLQGPLRPNVVLLQTCTNCRCVNPFHLTPLDPRNGSTAPDPRGAVNRAKRFCPNGHPLSGANLNPRPCGRRGCRACHREEQRRSRIRAKEKALQAQREFIESQPKDWFAELPELEPIEFMQPPALPIQIA